MVQTAHKVIDGKGERLLMNAVMLAQQMMHLNLWRHLTRASLKIHQRIGRRACCATLLELCSAKLSWMRLSPSNDAPPDSVLLDN